MPGVRNLVLASVDFTLGAGLEDLTLTGEALFAIGNDGRMS